MNEYISYFAGMVISGMLFMRLSSKYNWNEKYWEKVNRKTKESLNVIFWVMGATLFQVAASRVAGVFTADEIIIKLVTGIAIGFAFAFMPRKNVGINKG